MPMVSILIWILCIFGGLFLSLLFLWNWNNRKNSQANQSPEAEMSVQPQQAATPQQENPQTTSLLESSAVNKTLTFGTGCLGCLFVAPIYCLYLFGGLIFSKDIEDLLFGIGFLGILTLIFGIFMSSFSMLGYTRGILRGDLWYKLLLLILFPICFFEFAEWNGVGPVPPFVLISWGAMLLVALIALCYTILYIKNFRNKI